MWWDEYCDYTAKKHEQEIIDEVSTDISQKYRAGQKEHGGRLWRKPMVSHMVEEVNDLVVYLYTHRKQQLLLIGLLFEARDIMTRADEAGHYSYGLEQVNQALNLLLSGNVEGIEEEELG